MNAILTAATSVTRGQEATDQRFTAAPWITVAGWFGADDESLAALHRHVGSLEPHRPTFEFDRALILDQGVAFRLTTAARGPVGGVSSPHNGVSSKVHRTQPAHLS